jgi:hypothetical protein
LVAFSDAAEGEVCSDLALQRTLPKRLSDAHKEMMPGDGAILKHEWGRMLSFSASNR